MHFVSNPANEKAKRLLEMFYFVPSLIIFAIDVERLREVPINIIPSSPYNKNYY